MAISTSIRSHPRSAKLRQRQRSTDAGEPPRDDGEPSAAWLDEPRSDSSTGVRNRRHRGRGGRDVPVGSRARGTRDARRRRDRHRWARCRSRRPSASCRRTSGSSDSYLSTSSSTSAAVVVSHAGAGSVLGAAAQGIPQLLFPVRADQWENADAASGAGVAITLELDQRSEDHIGAAVTSIAARRSVQACSRLESQPRSLRCRRQPTMSRRLEAPCLRARSLTKVRDMRDDDDLQGSRVQSHRHATHRRPQRRVPGTGSTRWVRRECCGRSAPTASTSAPSGRGSASIPATSVACCATSRPKDSSRSSRTRRSAGSRRAAHRRPVGSSAPSSIVAATSSPRRCSPRWTTSDPNSCSRRWPPSNGC